MERHYSFDHWESAHRKGKIILPISSKVSGSNLSIVSLNIYQSSIFLIPLVYIYQVYEQKLS